MCAIAKIMLLRFSMTGSIVGTTRYRMIDEDGQRVHDTRADERPAGHAGPRVAAERLRLGGWLSVFKIRFSNASSASLGC